MSPPRVVLAFVLGTLAASACRKTPTADPTPSAQPISSASALPISSASAPPLASASASAPAGVPWLRPEVVTRVGDGYVALYPVEGALMVGLRDRLGRLVGDHVEWVRQFKPSQGIDFQFFIQHVSGRWPDLLGVSYYDGHPRETQVGFLLLQNDKQTEVFRTDGGPRQFAGFGRVGESSFVAGRGNGTSFFRTVEGPKLAYQNMLPKEARCTEEEIRNLYHNANAVLPDAMEGLPSGALISVGHLCGYHTPAAEIWDKGIKSRIVPLDRWFKKDVQLTVLRGPADDLLVYGPGSPTILRYKDGALEPMPSPGASFNLFLSDKGELHAFDGQQISRFAQERWTPVARLAWSTGLSSLILREGEFLFSGDGDIRRLVPGESLEMREGCATPFVFLYDVDWKNDRKFTFPSTRKALASFAEVDQLALVEFQEGGFRLGLVVQSEAQGRAVIEHLKGTMKKESPRLICYEPKNPRKIALAKKP